MNSTGTFTLLRMLADGRSRPGSELADALGCPVASLAGLLTGIEGLGLCVERVEGRHRLATPIDLLQVGELAHRLPRFRIDVVDECASTNSLLMERALAGAPHASVVAAEHQTAGRGRRGNAWLSAPGASLAFSLLWRFDRGAAGLPGLSLAAAVGAARALSSLGIAGVAVKWPNDLLIDGRKLGGMLIEASGSASRSAAVIGVGINVRLTSAMAAWLPDAADLAAWGPPPRTQLLAALLEHLAAVLDEFSSRGFAALRDEWHARHAWQDRDVALEVADRRVATGRAVGVDEHGALLLRSAAGVQRFHAGELSLRPA